MKLAGFNFTKIYAERKESKTTTVKIDTKINLKNIKEIKTNFTDSKESLLGLDFDYAIEYKDLANLDFSGNLVILIDQKKAKQIVTDFEKKKIEESFRLAIFNIILKRSSVRALQLEEELNLPTHFRLPSLKPEQKK